MNENIDALFVDELDNMLKSAYRNNTAESLLTSNDLFLAIRGAQQIFMRRSPNEDDKISKIISGMKSEVLDYGLDELANLNDVRDMIENTIERCQNYFDCIMLSSSIGQLTLASTKVAEQLFVRVIERMAIDFIAKECASRRIQTKGE